MSQNILIIIVGPHFTQDSEVLLYLISHNIPNEKEMVWHML